MLSLKVNLISDNGVKLIIDALYGNTTLLILDLGLNVAITIESLPLIEDIAKQSHLRQVDLAGTSISAQEVVNLHRLLQTPVEQREVPIKSSTKSAKKY